MGRPRKHPRRWFIANDTGVWVDEDNVPHHFYKGQTRLPEDSPDLQAMRMYFDPLDEDYPLPPEVEAATAAPGERRGERP